MTTIKFHANALAGTTLTLRKINASRIVRKLGMLPGRMKMGTAFVTTDFTLKFIKIPPQSSTTTSIRI